MRSRKLVHIVACHAEGEVGDVIVGGVAPPPGETLWAQARFVAQDQRLRRFVLNEPRGGLFRHVNLLVPARDPSAQAAFIIMEPEHTPPMSGSNAMCVATVLLETGLMEMREPETRLILEAPGGLIEVRAACHGGKVERVTVRNVASFADRLGIPLEVPGLGTLTVDTAYGGDSFVIADAAALGLRIAPEEARDIVDIGGWITRAANEQIGFRHPENAQWQHLSFCQIAAPVRREEGVLVAAGASVIEPGKIDRSPTGTGCSARMAVLHARGEMAPGERFLGRSIIGSEFHCRIAGLTHLAGRAAIVPEVSGRAWITGTRQEWLDPDDPWPEGYRLADTWPSRHGG